MSNTIRKDYYAESGGGPIFGEEWKAHADRKKWYKPYKKNKEQWLNKLRPGNKAKMRAAMKHPDVDGQIVLPVEKKTDCWYYN